MSVDDAARPAVPEVLWSPGPTDRQAANVTRFLEAVEADHGLRFASYEELWQWSVDELEDFWDAIWRFYDVRASTPPAGVLEDRRMPGATWFPGARLNYAEEVLRRAEAAHPALIALHEDGPPLEITTAELRGQVGALAAALREAGVVPGDRVAAYLPNIAEAVVALLAVTSLGAIWTACAPDFGTRSVVDRFGQVEPKVLLAVDGYRFNGRDHGRVDVVAELQASLPSVQTTILVRVLEPDAPVPATLGEATLAFDELVAASREPVFEQVAFDHPLWVLFSSGTTGLPKGLVQGHGGIVVEHLKALGLCMDLRPGDRYFFFSSTSWMAWNYLVGGLLHGATSVVYDGSPAHGGPDGIWRIAEEVGATVLGMGSAYATGCMKAGVDLSGRPGLSALRLVIPTGSPLPDAAWSWLHEQVAPHRTRIDHLCGGTDVCTVFFGGSPLLPVWFGEISGRWLGIDAHAAAPDGADLVDAVGEFVLRSPMPSMPLGLWGDEDGSRYADAYFDTYPGVWRQGDWLTITARGSAKVHGRSDATLNRGGVRLGSAEIYAIVEGLPEIADSLVVGVEQPDGGYVMSLFVVPAAGVAVDDELRGTIAATLRRQLSARHVPDVIVEVPVLARTLTGKKLEVPVKRILQGAPAGSVAAAGAIDHPEALAWFERHAAGAPAAG